MKRSILIVAVAIAVSLGGPSQALASDPADEDFVFGVIPQQSLGDKDFRTMAKGGVGSLRIAVYWPQVEPDFGEIDWSSYDALVRSAASRRISLLPYLYGTPSWAANYDGYECTGDCTIYAPASSATRGAFAFFAAEAVRQYGPGGRFWAANPDLPYMPVRAWQIWNEQNSSKYFAPEPDVASYGALLERTAQMIRSVDPEAEIVLGGMWGPDGSEGVVPTSAYLRQLYRRAETRQSFDSIGVHPYASDLSGVVSQIRSARRAARRAGDSRVETWITELGWASAGPAGHHLVKGHNGQARILREAYEALLKRSTRWRLRGAFWYAWKDTAPTAGFICLWCPGAGLRSVAGGPKPAWRSLKRIARATGR